MEEKSLRNVIAKYWCHVSTLLTDFDKIITNMLRREKRMLSKVLSQHGDRPVTYLMSSHATDKRCSWNTRAILLVLHSPPRNISLAFWSVLPVNVYFITEPSTENNWNSITRPKFVTNLISYYITKLLYTRSTGNNW